MIDLATVTREAFDPHLGAGYTLHAPSRTIALELTEVRSLPTRAGARAAFALELRASGDRSHVPQAIYPIEHPRLGRFEVFIVPVGPDAVGMRYEIIFG